MQSIQPFRMCSALQRKGALIKIAVRFGGGGGRPGGRPTFNWKERRALGLDGAQAQLKEFKARPIGFDYADLEKHIDTSRGDSVVDLTNVDSWTETPRPAVNHRKVVDVAMLFGSNKPCGPYLSPREKETGVLKRFRRKFL